MDILTKGCTNPEDQDAVNTKFYKALPNTCGSLVWNVTNATVVGLVTLIWLI